jgi:hypothetical protein
MKARIGGRLSSSFTAHAGVKQGDPLSPLLFGLFIDKIEKFFAARLGDTVGVRMAGQILRVLLYADDLAIMAETPQHLQQMLDCLAEFCEACAMTVNTKKSEIVVFNRKLAPAALPTWQYKGQPLPVNAEFRYLGTVFSQNGVSGGVAGARDRQVKAAQAALNEMWRRCYALRIRNVNTLCYLFGALIQPVASYGCEVWAPDVLCKKRGEGIIRDGKQEHMHNTFIRQALGLRECTPVEIMLGELGRKPLWTFWLCQCCKFWNKTVALPDTDLTKQALLENVCMAVSDNCKECWAHCFLQCMCTLGIFDQFSQAVQETGDDGRPRKLLPMNMAIATTAMQRSMVEAWAAAKAQGPPRDIPADQHKGFKLAVHAAWFQVEDSFDKRKSFAAHLKWKQHITAVARFRMGSHSLDIEARRWGKEFTSRPFRRCTCCDLGIVEDELHVVCECPAYGEARKRFMDNELERGGQSGMKSLMNGDGSERHWQAVAQYLITCGKIRANIRLQQIQNGTIAESRSVDM